MASEINEKNSSDGEKNKVNENLNDTLEARKKKLKDEISELKDLIYQIECNMKISQFKEIQILIDPEESFSIRSQMIQNISNVEIDIQNDLYRYMGFYCTKFSESYIFNFISTPICTKNDVYTVQIINKDGVGKLGKWIMPFSIDINEILDETSIEKVNEIPLFLRNCKHKLHYHYFRMKQFQDLKASLSDLKNCKLDTDLGYTQITLELIGVMEIESGQSYNIVLYFYYESDDVRPRILKIDSLMDTQLSDEEVKKFKKFFKHFKNFELKLAFETALNATHTVFLWNKETVENDFIELSGNDSKIVKSKRKRQNESKESREKRQRIDESNVSNLHSSQESQQEEYRSESENESQITSAVDNKKNRRTVKSKTNNMIKKVHEQDLVESENNSKELLSIQKKKRKTTTAVKEVKENSKIFKKKSKGADPKQRTLNFGIPLEKNVDNVDETTTRKKSIKWADEILEKEKENESTSVITNINEHASIPTSTPIRQKKMEKDHLIVPTEQEISVINKATDTFPVPTESESINEPNIQGEQVVKSSKIPKDSNNSRDTDSETEAETEIADKELLSELQSINEKKRTVITKKPKTKSSLPVKKVKKGKALKNKK